MNRHFQPVKLLLPNEEVARRLADAIRTGFFRLGSRLPSERSIAEQMQVSRPTVREAVKLLVEANILTVKPGAGGGTFVSSEIVPLDLIVSRPDMRPGDIDEAIEVRRLILPWVAQIASQYAEDADFDRMREAIRFGRDALPPPEVTKSSPEHINSIIIASMRFDLALAQATRNSLVLELMELLLQWVEPMRRGTLHTRADLSLSLELIEIMLQAVESGDLLRIADITERRLGILENALEEQTGRRLRRNRRPANAG
ncbi:GntR family transcriptional regulator [Neorhizobium galegae]|uniref:FadR/GntR family transcriptional regulator n=1 Tax=Neorhizobium galegae TaxID=399 RepID=UPI0006225BB4|nr:GntR family transcriptional regulator [Neorhizobium galegae]MCQ1845713.1 GntR family transcriptional regulator [Neorhizobium galegae]CDZ42495.1 Transcriptional regulator [Neorhizobium galegae bv. officinalis]